MTEVRFRDTRPALGPFDAAAAPSGGRASALGTLGGAAFLPPPRLMRIVTLLTDAYGGIGGIAKFNRDLLAALADLPECREILAYPRLVQREPEAIPPKVEYRFDAARGKGAYVAAVLGLMARVWEPVDLVICGHVNLLPLAWPLARLKRCPLLLIVHGIEVWSPHPNRLVRRLLWRTDRVAAVSRYTAERLAAWSGVPVEHFRILPNCVDLGEYYPRPRDVALARRYGLEGRRVLVTVGRLAGKERYKGFDEVLEALPELLREEPGLCYVIVGDGADRPRLEEKAAGLGLADHVIFTGYVSEEEKKGWYSLADVFVMPSRGEGFGIVFLEAMASGVPVIGSSVDGSREALLDGRLGLLVDPGDRGALIAAIREAFSRPRGRPPGVEYFDVAAFQQRVTELVRELVAARVS